MNKIYTAPVHNDEFALGLGRLLDSGWRVVHLKFFTVEMTQTGFAVLWRSADYKQFEMKIAAHLKQSKQDGVDLHTQCAAEIFATTPADVTPEQRRFAKEKTFVELYGGAAGFLRRNP